MIPLGDPRGCATVSCRRRACGQTTIEKKRFAGAASGDEQSVLVAVGGVDEMIVDEMKRETASAL